MYCSKCGAELSNDAAFCSSCGANTDSTVADSANESSETNVIVKSKKECIYDAFCKYVQSMTPFATVQFGELENYEEGKDNKIYTELVRTSKNNLGATVKTRFGAVINEVEPDGNCVFKEPGPQMMSPLLKTKLLKATFGFRSLGKK